MRFSSCFGNQPPATETRVSRHIRGKFQDIFAKNAQMFIAVFRKRNSQQRRYVFGVFLSFLLETLYAVTIKDQFHETILPMNGSHSFFTNSYDRLHSVDLKQIRESPLFQESKHGTPGFWLGRVFHLFLRNNKAIVLEPASDPVGEGRAKV